MTKPTPQEIANFLEYYRQEAHHRGDHKTQRIMERLAELAAAPPATSTDREEAKRLVQDWLENPENLAIKDEV